MKSAVAISLMATGATIVSGAAVIKPRISETDFAQFAPLALSEVGLSLVQTPDDTIVLLDQLIPQFGVQQGVAADQVQIGSCNGFSSGTDEAVLIPCDCPPDRAIFLDMVGRAILNESFFGDSTTFNMDINDQTDETNKIRANVATFVLQSFNLTKGVGCPSASAPNFLIMQINGTKIDQVFVE
jgi:hypothetical protein